MSDIANQTKVEAVRQSTLVPKREQFQFSIPLPDNVLNVLSANANVAITDFEVLLGQVNYTAEVCLNVIYSLDDGTISNYKNCENITGKIEDISLDPNTLIKLLPNVIDVEIEKMDNNSINIKITLEYEMGMVKNQGIELFNNKEESVFVKENNIEIAQHISRNYTNFNQSTVFDTKMPVKQILNTVSSAIITKADPLDGMIIFEGEVVTRILYTTNDDRPVLVSLTSRENFREEVEDPKSTKTSIVEGFARAMNRGIEETINNDEKTIEVLVPVRICYDLFETSPVNVIIDAYSTENEVNLSTEAFISNQSTGYEIFENKIDGSVTLAEQSLRIDKILGVDGAYITINSHKYENGELEVQGMLHLNIIFLNDETENVNSISIEVPFSFKEKIGDGELNIKLENYLTDIDAVVKRGKDIYVDGKIKTAVWLDKEIKNAAITKIETGEPLPQRDGTIEIYFASEGEDFWSVAKDLKISEEILKIQNPDIVEPFIQPQKIVYYEQKDIPEV